MRITDLNKKTSVVKKIEYKLCLFFIFSALHYRLYYLLGISASIIGELFFFTIAFLYIKKLLKISFFSLGCYLTVPFYIFSWLVGDWAIENKLFYKSALNKYEIIYSSELESCTTSRGITTCTVRMLYDTTKTKYIGGCYAVPRKYNLISYPKLAYDDNFLFYSLYRKKLFDNNPTDIQLEYCKQGARCRKKIWNLERYSGIRNEDEILDYVAQIKKHENRIISAVIEKRGDKYLFVNALQSEDKLWAIKYRNVDDGKKVLMIYDVNSPSLFAIIDWNPTDEDYDYYNTNEGRKPAFKYLLKLDAIASSSSSMEMEEKTDFEE